MIICKAEFKDLYELVEMWGRLSDYHKSFKDYMPPSCFWREMIIELFKEDLEDDNKNLLVAKDRDRIAGFLREEVRMSSKISSSIILGYISDIYVEENYRGANLGDKLFEEGIKWFRVKGVNDIRLNVNSENNRAINFYKKYGFEEVNKTLALKLND